MSSFTTDHSKQPKNKRKLAKTKQISNDYQYLDEDEEKSFADKKARSKKPTEKKEVEKNEELIKRLADKFNNDDDDDDNNSDDNKDNKNNNCENENIEEEDH